MEKWFRCQKSIRKIEKYVKSTGPISERLMQYISSYSQHHGRSQDFFGGDESTFSKKFQKYAKKFVNNFEKN